MPIITRPNDDAMEATHAHSQRLAAFYSLVRLQRQFAAEFAARDRADAIADRIIGWVIVLGSTVSGIALLRWLTSSVSLAHANLLLLTRTSFWGASAISLSVAITLFGLAIARVIRVPWLTNVMVWAFNAAFVFLIAGVLVPAVLASL